MAERSKALDSKSSRRPKSRLVSSNLTLSAIKNEHNKKRAK